MQFIHRLLLLLLFFFIFDLNPDPDLKFVHQHELFSLSLVIFSVLVCVSDIQRLADQDREHMLCVIHIPYISNTTLSQEICAPRAKEMLTVHTCGVKMNHMCAIGRNLPVFSERAIQQCCHEHFYGLRRLCFCCKEGFTTLKYASPNNLSILL